MSKQSSRTNLVASAIFMAMTVSQMKGFTAPRSQSQKVRNAFLGASVSEQAARQGPLHLELNARGTCSDDNGSSSGCSGSSEESPLFSNAARALAAAAISTAFLFHTPNAFAEDELAARYGGKGFDSSLVDQTCLVNSCSQQAKACLADDPSCRKGLTCTAKCMGDNACITGCMARYGDRNLDNLLKCTIEDNECIKVAILEGGADAYGEEPRSPAPTVRSFDTQSLEGSWFKVVGFNPNYDCYACQRNTFSAPESSNPMDFFSGEKSLEVGVEFSMPHLLPDGSPPPPKNVRETIQFLGADSAVTELANGPTSIGLNDYSTHEVMVFDNAQTPLEAATNLVLGKGTPQGEATYARTAHSEGEMFGLKFWENWYIIGENDPGSPEFKFVYYNGKTRQNTYSGAFVYSRTRDLAPESMKKVYAIATEAGMNPDNFCKIRNGCFENENADPAAEVGEYSGLGSPSNPFRGILASTKVSQLLGVQAVAAENIVQQGTPTAKELNPIEGPSRAWWHEVGDYLENPHRHFDTMSSLRLQMDWPEDVKSGKE